MLAANPPRLGRRLWSYVTLARLRKRAARTRRAPRAAYLTPSHQAARTSKALQPVLNGMQPTGNPGPTKALPSSMHMLHGLVRATEPACDRSPGGRLADWPRLAEALCGAARQPSRSSTESRPPARASAEPYRHAVTTCHPGIVARVLQPLLGQLGLLGLVAELLQPLTLGP